MVCPTVGKPVGHEQDDWQRALGWRLPEGIKERVVDVGSTPRGHSVEELGGVLDRRARLSDRPLGERLDTLVVEDHVERLTVVKTGEYLEGGLANLRKLLAAHAAGTVDDQRHFTTEGRRFRLGRPWRQSGQEQEISPADLRVGVGEQRG